MCQKYTCAKNRHGQNAKTAKILGNGNSQTIQHPLKRSSAIVEGLCDMLCQSKSSQVLQNCIKITSEKVCSAWMTFKVTQGRWKWSVVTTLPSCTISKKNQDIITFTAHVTSSDTTVEILGHICFLIYV